MIYFWKGRYTVEKSTPSQTTNLDTYKLTEFADKNFKLDENGRDFSKRVENTLGKREIAHYMRFHLFPLCFQKNVNCSYVNTWACLGRGYRGEGWRE